MLALCSSRHPHGLLVTCSPTPRVARKCILATICGYAAGPIRSLWPQPMQDFNLYSCSDPAALTQLCQLLSPLFCYAIDNNSHGMTGVTDNHCRFSEFMKSISPGWSKKSCPEYRTFLVLARHPHQRWVIEVHEHWGIDAHFLVNN